MKKTYIAPLCLAHKLHISAHILTASQLKLTGNTAAQDNKDTKIEFPGANSIFEEPEEASQGWIEID
ncbi:MAG: hypothetical protein MJZ32_08630 [Bacteroidaceae bacterium]|nr:hypothetical protein [Bacteroidaceae bacterium]